MDQLIPTKPYMLRAMHEWCMDNGLTPHLIVAVNNQTRVPMAYVKDGEIVLNINYSATKDLHIDNESVVFSARFGGVSQHLYIPMNAVKGIFARENGQGMFFELDAAEDGHAAGEPVESAESVESAKNSPDSKPKAGQDKKPTLTIVK